MKRGASRLAGARLARVLALVGLLFASAGQALEIRKLTPWAGGETPPLALKDLDGKAHQLSDYRGKVVVINFWATWCGPCVAEMPSLQKLRERINDQYPGEPLQVLAVNLAESPTKAGDFAQKLKLALPVLLDRDEEAKDAWKVRFVPATFIVAADGKVRYSYFGDADWASDEMVARLSAIVAEQ